MVQKRACSIEDSMRQSEFLGYEAFIFFQDLFN